MHIVTGAVSAAQNIVKVRAPLRPGGQRSDPAAAGVLGIAVLTEDEKELGVCLVDIGGGTTDIAVFREGRDPAHRGDPDCRRPDHQ